MEQLKIGGVLREVILKQSVIVHYIEKFNTYYRIATYSNRKEEEKFLVQLATITDEEDKLKKLNEFVEFIEKKQKAIPFPYAILYDALWDILADYEKNRFRNKFFKRSKNVMIKEIREDELQPILDFLSTRVFKLIGYKKKV